MAALFHDTFHSLCRWQLQAVERHGLRTIWASVQQMITANVCLVIFFTSVVICRLAWIVIRWGLWVGRLGAWCNSCNCLSLLFLSNLSLPSSVCLSLSLSLYYCSSNLCRDHSASCAYLCPALPCCDIHVWLAGNNSCYSWVPAASGPHSAVSEASNTPALLLARFINNHETLPVSLLAATVQCTL